jgi:hypothetical protein
VENVSENSSQNPKGTKFPLKTKRGLDQKNRKKILVHNFLIDNSKKVLFQKTMKNGKSINHKKKKYF